MSIQYIRIKYGIVYTPPSPFSGVNAISSVCCCFFSFFLSISIFYFFFLFLLSTYLRYPIYLSIHPPPNHTIAIKTYYDSQEHVSNPQHRTFHQPSRKNVTYRNNNGGIIIELKGRTITYRQVSSGSRTRRGNRGFSVLCRAVKLQIYCYGLEQQKNKINKYIRFRYLWGNVFVLLFFSFSFPFLGMNDMNEEIFSLCLTYMTAFRINQAYRVWVSLQEILLYDR